MGLFHFIGYIIRKFIFSHEIWKIGIKRVLIRVE
jgi:hypothetical protein